MERYWKGIVAVGGGALSYAFGGWSVLLQLLIGIAIIDYASGVIASAVEGKLSSKIGYKGIFKKIMIFFVVAVGHFIDVMMNTHSSVRDAATIFYIVNEVLSILENAGRAGVPVPDVIKKAIQVLQNKDKDKDGDV